jgi:PAS domain S-box-containing protein
MNESFSSQISEQYFENSMDMLCLVDSEGNLKKVNAEWEKTLGYSLTEMEGKNFLDFIHPEDIGMAMELRKKLVNEEKVRGFISRYRHKQGHYHWIEWHSFALEGIHYASARDITKYKQTEEMLPNKHMEELSRSERKYRLLFENLTSGFALHQMIYDEGGKAIDYRYIEANPAFERLTGLSAKEIIGKTIKEMAPETEEYWIQAFGNVAMTGKPMHFMNYSKTQGRYYESFIFCPDKDKFAVVFNDASDRVIAEKALNESESRFRAVVENMPLGIGVADLEGNISFVNKTFLNYFGYELKEVPSLEKWFMLTYPEETDRNKVMKLWKEDVEEVKQFKSAHSIARVYSIKAKSGKMFDVEIGFTVIEDHIYIIFNDISDKTKAEKSLRESEARWQFALEGAGDGLWDWNIETNQVFYSRQWKSMLGYNEEEIGDTLGEWDKLVHPEDKERIYDQIEKHFRGESTIFESEQRILCKNGSYKFILARGKVVSWKEGGKPTRIIGMHTDITERIKLDHERQSNLIFFESMDRINRAIQGTKSLELIMTDVLNIVQSIFKCDRAFVAFPCDPEMPELVISSKSVNPLYAKSMDKPIVVPMFPNIEKLLHELLNSPEPYEINQEQGLNADDEPWRMFEVKSQLAIALYPKLGKAWVFVLHQCSYSRKWTAQEKKLFQEISRRLADSLTSMLVFRNLRDSEDFLNNIVENIPNMIFVKDAENLRFVRLNKAGEELLGFSREDMLGKNDYDFFPKKEADFFTLKDRNVLKTKKFLDIPREKILNKHNEERILHTKKIPLLDETGKPKFLLGISEDITDIIKAEKALKETKERLQSFMDSATDSIVIWDKDMKLLEINQAAFQYMPFYSDRNEVIGKSIFELSPFIENKEDIAHFKKVLATGEPFFSEGQIPFSDDKTFWVDIRVFKVGEGLGVLTSDITERKNAEAALFETRERLQSFMDSATDAMVIFDGNMNIIELNKNALLYFPWFSKKEDAIGKNVSGYFREYASNYTIQSFKDVLNKGEAFSFETYIDHGENDKYCFFTKIFKVGKELGMVASNITEIKKAEKSIKILNMELEEKVKERTAQLEQVNKDLEAFAYSVSHDLRAPLRHVDGFVRLLYSNIPSPSTAMASYFEKINSSSKRMSSMIDELLTFSRLGRKELTLEPVDLNVLVNEVIEEFRPDYAQRFIEWKTRKIPMLKGDKTLLKVVFENLISNAIKYTSKKEVAIIEIGAIKVSDQQISIYVKDNGVGFDMSYSNKLFGVFQRLHSNEEFEGIGIGLANVNRIILKHKGGIHAEAKINEGATFIITLPV